VFTGMVENWRDLPQVPCYSIQANPSGSKAMTLTLTRGLRVHYAATKTNYNLVAAQAKCHSLTFSVTLVLVPLWLENMVDVVGVVQRCWGCKEEMGIDKDVLAECL